MAIRRPRTPFREVLEADGRRQDWLAARVGASPAEMSRWVNGLHEPIDPTKAAIAEALGRSVEELWPESVAA
jgi:lambda repressor-like predicted transcriptional regulator